MGKIVPLLVRLPHVQVLVARHLDRAVRDVYREIPINSLMLTHNLLVSGIPVNAYIPLEKGDN